MRCGQILYRLSGLKMHESPNVANQIIKCVCYACIKFIYTQNIIAITGQV